MNVVCAWCETVLLDAGGSISHGICESCAVNVERTFLRATFPPRRSRRSPRPASPLNPTLPGFALV